MRQEVLMKEQEILASYSYRYKGSWSRIAQALTDHEEPFLCDIREKYITILDEDYPKELKALRFPPWVLFYEGDLALLKQPKIAIVGSRNLSSYGTELTIRASTELKKRFVLVSGLAKGADGIVHECALEQGHSIGVIGSGLGTCYPKENRNLYAAMKKHDLILSEYPFHTGVRREHFPWRNRILAALGQALIVTEAKYRSGTMLSVNEALSLSKEIYTFPHPFESESGSGCNRLIADGANILYTMEQLKEIRPKLDIG